MSKPDARQHLDALRTYLTGVPITRRNVRHACRSLGLTNHDDAYEALTNRVAFIGRDPDTVPQVTLAGSAERQNAFDLLHRPPEAVPQVSLTFSRATDRTDTTLTRQMVEDAVEHLRTRKGSIPASPGAPITIPTLHWEEPVLVLSDLHIPMHDADFLNRSVDVALREGCTRFIIAGDLTDNNQWHARTHDIRTERRWQDDIILARSVLGALCADFAEGYIFFGNHDEWIMKAARGQIETDWLYAQLFPDLPLTFSYKHQVRLVQAGETWTILHGEHFSSANPLGPMVDYAVKHFQTHVLGGHQHYALQWRTGPYQLIVNGGSFDASRMDYLHKRPKKHAPTQQGFTIIKRGHGRLYTPHDLAQTA